ncbi:hypothetical protein SCUCBS95973_007534 [Sporothrix curviconia]|uniref:Uncharacterized protein n=1 Tax=Sporothrix curviconia TaxID=1260050 RepID=A0ABP0CFB0_9PEZI
MTPRSPHVGGPGGGGPGAPMGSSYGAGAGREGYFDSPASVRSPPTGPSSLRPPPGGPNSNRKLALSPGPSTPQGGRGRGEASPQSSAAPPTGPRGFGPGRLGGAGAERGAGIGGNGPGGPNGPYTPRQGRGNGAWPLPGGPGRRMSSAGQSPNVGGPAGRGDGGGGIPTGPRATPGGPSGSAANGLGGPNGRSRGGSPSGPRPFNPPTGPASQQQGSQQQQMQSPGLNGDRGNYHRDPRDRERPGRGSLAISSSAPTVAQQAMSSMPAIIHGGKLDPLLHTGILPEMLPHYQRLREEEERLRAEMDMKQDRLRKQLRSWDKMEREARAFKLKSDLSEKSLKTIAGEDMGGAAF